MKLGLIIFAAFYVELIIFSVMNALVVGRLEKRIDQLEGKD